MHTYTHTQDGFQTRVTLDQPAHEVSGSHGDEYKGMLLCVLWQILTDVSEKLTASIIRLIALITEAVRNSETFVSISQTTRKKSPRR
jgi:hypothetical protein